ncbi:alkylhydroperoxidase domain protein [Salana multivorans]|uniref:Alkylhydroperoxidase domain protein n=1 Tax=Salana multivorans TaxID=120377 RepID=A0A3N2D013_9MICO|nr:peroxidase-related enzyme [Salana multivorans]ROR93111.1 alkylhydroperoxidase domain protein [Salana multivorans]
MTTAPTTDLHRPEHFTRDALGWVPWLEPPTADELTPEQVEALVEPGRVASPYFRLLALAPEILESRTRADLDMVLTGAPRPGQDGEGLPRPERELASTVASRLNGCVFCASVHSRLAAQLGKRPEEVDLLLRDGVAAADRLEPRWAAVVRAAAALSATPPTFDAENVAELRAVGLSTEAVLDAVGSAAFFAWANRLMLSLGEPEVPAPR